MRARTRKQSGDWTEQKRAAIQATTETLRPRVIPMLRAVDLLAQLQTVKGWPDRVAIRVHSGAIWIHKRLSPEELAATQAEHAKLLQARKDASDDETRRQLGGRIRRLAKGLYPDADGWTYYGVVSPDRPIIERPGDGP